MRKAIFFVPCTSFGAAERAAGGLKESWPLSPSHRGPRAGSQLPHVGLELLAHLVSGALPAPTLWAASNLRGQGPGAPALS